MSRGEQESEPESDLGLGGFGTVPDDRGVSLERLSESFARLLGQGEPPYPPGESDRAEASAAPSPAEGRPADGTVHPEATTADDDVCPVAPGSILEAILFVGHPDNEPLAAGQIAGLMRGVRPAEIDQLVRQLNATYTEEGCPYHIESVGGGYRMSLRPGYHRLRENFYGRIRQARLSQSAIDVLAIVAYHQPVARQTVDQLRDRPSGPILAQLVRRRLLRIQRRDDPHRTAEYFTTDRFLDLFGLESLDALPHQQELDDNG
jgi:segregation and condensation protein B